MAAIVLSHAWNTHRFLGVSNFKSEKQIYYVVA